jgi:hypothetical protein
MATLEEKAMKHSATLIVIAAVATGAFAQSSRAAAEEQAVLRFADLNGIKDWRPDKSTDADAILIEGRNGDWYRATFSAPCPEVRFAPGVAFETDPLGNLDRFTSIIVEGRRCSFKTFERTADPEEKQEPRAIDTVRPDKD